MRTSLSHLPEYKQHALARVVEMIHEEFEKAHAHSTTGWKKNGRIEKIILFGSHARDDWVDDNRLGGYRSDYDLCIIVSNTKLTRVTATWRMRVEDRLLRLMSSNDWVPGPEFTLIVHTLHEVNEQLERGRQFFINIAGEGIALYQMSGSKGFLKPKPLTPEIALEESRMYFEEWYTSAVEFYDDYVTNMERVRHKKAAFYLHQAVENTYTCLMLVFVHHSPETHNIKHLRSKAEQLDERLIEIWPRETKKQSAPYNLLNEAYVKARYSRHFKIEPEDLEWLGERVEQLLKVTKTICEEKLHTMVSRLSSGD